MESSIYIGVVGDESLIKLFAEKVNLKNSTVKELCSKNENVKVKPWKWRTAIRDCNTLDPEDSIEPFLKEHEYLLNQLNQFKGKLTCDVVLLYGYEIGDSARGLILSNQLIQLLSKFNAGIIIDALGAQW